MRRAVQRLTLTAFAAAVLLAVLAVPALAAAPTAVTNPASNISAVTAKLNGTINPAGYQIQWQFQYGTNPDYTKDQATPIQTIPAGNNNNLTVQALVKRLRPGTKYYFRLVIVASGSYYYSTPMSGGDRTFKTRGTGFLNLANGQTIIKVKAATKKLSVKFTCASDLTCKGKFSIVFKTKVKVKGKTKTATVVVTSGKTTGYTIKAHKSKTVTATVLKGAINLLRSAKGHKMIGKLSSYPRTGQHALIQNVVLQLK